jgi:hypothetical protein
VTTDFAGARESSLRRNRLYWLVARISASLFGPVSTSLMIGYLGGAKTGLSSAHLGLSLIRRRSQVEYF